MPARNALCTVRKGKENHFFYESTKDLVFRLSSTAISWKNNFLLQFLDFLWQHTKLLDFFFAFAPAREQKNVYARAFHLPLVSLALLLPFGEANESLRHIWISSNFPPNRCLETFSSATCHRWFFFLGLRVVISFFFGFRQWSWKSRRKANCFYVAGLFRLFRHSIVRDLLLSAFIRLECEKRERSGVRWNPKKKLKCLRQQHIMKRKLL